MKALKVFIIIRSKQMDKMKTRKKEIVVNEMQSFCFLCMQKLWVELIIKPVGRMKKHIIFSQKLHVS